MFKPIRHMEIITEWQTSNSVPKTWYSKIDRYKRLMCTTSGWFWGFKQPPNWLLVFKPNLIKNLKKKLKPLLIKNPEHPCVPLTKKKKNYSLGTVIILIINYQYQYEYMMQQHYIDVFKFIYKLTFREIW